MYRISYSWNLSLTFSDNPIFGECSWGKNIVMKMENLVIHEINVYLLYWISNAVAEGAFEIHSKETFPTSKVVVPLSSGFKLYLSNYYLKYQDNLRWNSHALSNKAFSYISKLLYSKQFDEITCYTLGNILTSCNDKLDTQFDHYDVRICYDTNSILVGFCKIYNDIKKTFDMWMTYG